MLNKYFLQKKILIYVSILLILSIAVIICLWRTALLLEIATEKNEKSIKLKSEDIEKIGIDLLGHDAGVVISLVPEKCATLEELTRENARKEIIIRTSSNILSRGVILHPIVRGAFVITVDSEDGAFNIIKKLGRDKPDYYYKPTTEELKLAKHDRSIYNLPWAKEAMEATANRDYAKAAEFVQKAIAANPKEPYFYFISSMIYYEQNKKNLALNQLLKAKEMIKDEDICKYRGIYRGLVELYSEFKSYDKSISTYQILVTSKCYLFSFDHIKIAKIYEKIGNTDLALQEYTLLSKADDKKISEIGLLGIERLTK